MSLGDFHSEVKRAQEERVVQRRSRGNRDSRGGARRRPPRVGDTLRRPMGRRTLADRVQNRREPKVKVEAAEETATVLNPDDFPKMFGLDESETTTTDLGSWAEGADPIRQAKDLPAPTYRRVASRRKAILAEEELDDDYTYDQPCVDDYSDESDWEREQDRRPYRRDETPQYQDNEPDGEWNAL